MEQQSMSKVMRRLAGSGLAAVLGVLLVGFSGAFGVQEAAAESPPNPPARFAGSVTVDGAPVPPGTVITAKIGSASCGATSTFTSGAEARYVLDVPALDPGATPNCGADGSVVVFYIGALKANESGTWRNYDINVLNLTATSPPSPTPVATPKPPVTGQGTVDNGSTGTLFFALGIGALALAAAGAVSAVRRGR
jgi:hypothetical protein